MIIFVTGKSGSGKSTFAKKMSEELCFKYVDVDKIAHSIYDFPEIIKQAENLFGKVIYDDDGTFNRKKLGQIFFKEKDSKRVKEYKDLTWRYMETQIDSLIQSNENIILDWILFPETKYWNLLAYKILVYTEDNNKRFEKLLERDNVSLEYLKLRDQSSIEYDFSDFNYKICNDYAKEKIIEHIKNIKHDLECLFRFEVLGTKSPFANKENACPSYLITMGDTKIMLDCGSGSHRFYDMTKLDNLNIILSHLHRDHYNDIYNYMYSSYSLKNLRRVKQGLNIYLPSTPVSIVEDIKNEKLTYGKIYTYDSNSKLEWENISVDFLKVDHSKEMDCYAIRVKTNNKTIVYTGDVSFSNMQSLVEFAKNCDVLICESSLLVRHNFPEINSHLTAFQAGKIAKQANAKKLLLTHFWAEEPLEEYVNEAKINFKTTKALEEQNTFYI